MTSDDLPDYVRGFRDNASATSAIATGAIQVLGGTAWLWADAGATESVDTLFVDEAGQMSLASVLAVAPAAGSVVLLGDPQQLDQPQKASHPDGVDVSALSHIIGSTAVVAAALDKHQSGRGWREREGVARRDLPVPVLPDRCGRGP